MIKGYFINLDAAHGRLAHMQSEAQRLSLPLSRLPAVNGHRMDDASFERWQPERGPMHLLSRPELACFLSHRAAWKKIAEASDGYGAVFEDDLTFADDAAHYFETTDWIPDEADVIKIETTSRKVMLDKPARPAGNDRQTAKLASRHLGGGGYILSRDFARRLLAATDPVRIPVDYALFDPDLRVIADASVWQLLPAICVQQVRTREKFLPDTAEDSGLDTARTGLKRRGFAKLLRELNRPFADLATELGARLQAARYGRRWTFVKFRR